jgi:kynureninase
VDLTRAAAEALDTADPLAPFRARFAGAGEDGLLYLDGNSLGRMPVETPAVLARVVEEEWARGLVRSWSSWVGAATRVGDLLAEGVLGARPGEVLVPTRRRSTSIRAPASRPGCRVRRG